jgi:hypothetical protein
MQDKELFEPFVIVEILEIIIELHGQRINLDCFNHLQQYLVRKIFDVLYQFACQGRVILQGKLKQFNLCVYLFLPFKDGSQFCEVSLRGDGLGEELVILVEGNFEVFVEDVQQSHSHTLGLLLTPLEALSRADRRLSPLHLLESEQSVLLLSLQVAKDSDDAGSSFRLALLVFQEDLHGRQFEIGDDVEDPLEKPLRHFLADRRELLAIDLRIYDVLRSFD